MNRKITKHWVLTYSYNDYYGEKEQFCCFIKFQKNIRAAISKDDEKRKEKFHMIFPFEKDKKEEILDGLKRTSPDTFELIYGDHCYIAKLVEPFEASIN